MVQAWEGTACSLRSRETGRRLHNGSRSAYIIPPPWTNVASAVTMSNWHGEHMRLQNAERFMGYLSRSHRHAQNTKGRRGQIMESARHARLAEAVCEACARTVLPASSSMLAQSAVADAQEVVATPAIARASSVMRAWALKSQEDQKPEITSGDPRAMHAQQRRH